MYEPITIPADAADPIVVAFPQPYSTAPTVFLATEDDDLSVQVTDLTGDGFTLVYAPPAEVERIVYWMAR